MYINSIDITTTNQIKMDHLGESNKAVSTTTVIQAEEIYGQVTTSTTVIDYVFGAGPTAFQKLTECTISGGGSPTNGVTLLAPPAPAGTKIIIDEAMESMRASVAITARNLAGGSERTVELGFFLNGFFIPPGIKHTVKGSDYNRMFIHPITGFVPAGTEIEIAIAVSEGMAMTLEISHVTIAVNGPKAYV